MTPDRHLGAAWIDRCRPDLLITESTYATTIRDSKRCRERDFLKKVHDCVDKGGKVLIPVFALGRAQELCILLETYWERMNLKVTIKQLCSQIKFLELSVGQCFEFVILFRSLSSLQQD
jgi:integrator complex subunit 11